MRRAHRLAHRMLWPALIVVVVLGFTLALALRPSADEPPVTETQTP
jgi:hypothetical protein